MGEVEVESVEAALQAIKVAERSRAAMAAEASESPSRSHEVVQVKTACRSKKDQRECTGRINFIDLAGSESTNKSDKNLNALGEIMQALIAKAPQVPYRNSKLTMMLKDSLGGDAKTLVLVHCSPAQCNAAETLSSLTFAARARNVELLSKAKRGSKSSD